MKRVLVLCNTNIAASMTREKIINIVKKSGHNVIKIENNIKALESLQNSVLTDLVIIGQHANASEMIKWIERRCSGVPIIFIGNCECESEKIAHTDNEIDESALENELPALLDRLIGSANPLK